MRTSKLHAWRDAELDEVASVLNEAASGWRAAWGLASDSDACVRVATAHDCQTEGWQPIGTHAVPVAWVQWSDLARSRLQSLFGSSAASTDLTAEAAAACGRDAASRFARALQIEAGADTGAQPEAACGKWSGAAMATLPCGSRMLLTSACIRRVLRMSACSVRPPRSALPSLSSVLQAADGCETRVEARLADCDLELSMLQRLRIGDVVRLPHPLNQPLGVHVAGDRPVFAGFLARSGAHRAIELVSTPV